MEKHVLIIDNHDSFVYNVTGLLEKMRRLPDHDRLRWRVIGCDTVCPSDVTSSGAVILSPGPGLPSEAGRLMTAVACAAAHRVPTLGICLGYQAIAQHFGARLLNLPVPRHGHLSHLCRIDASDPVMGPLADTSPAVGRYHSWVVDAGTLPTGLVPTSFDEDGNIMSLRHAHLPLFGTQFHPESIITDCGEHIMAAFLDTASKCAHQRME